MYLSRFRFRWLCLVFKREGLRDRQNLFGSGGGGGGGGGGDIQLTIDPSFDLDTEVDGLRGKIGRMKGVSEPSSRPSRERERGTRRLLLTFFRPSVRSSTSSQLALDIQHESRLNSDILNSLVSYPPSPDASLCCADPPHFTLYTAGGHGGQGQDQLEADDEADRQGLQAHGELSHPAAAGLCHGGPHPVLRVDQGVCGRKVRWKARWACLVNEM